MIPPVCHKPHHSLLSPKTLVPNVGCHLSSRLCCVFLVRRNTPGFSDSPYTWLAFCMCGYLLASESPWLCNCWFTPGQRGSTLQPPVSWCVLFPVWLQHPQEISPGGTPAQEGTHLLPSPAASSSPTGDLLVRMALPLMRRDRPNQWQTAHLLQ